MLSCFCEIKWNGRLDVTQAETKSTGQQNFKNRRRVVIMITFSWFDKEIFSLVLRFLFVGDKNAPNWRSPEEK